MCDSSRSDFWKRALGLLILTSFSVISLQAFSPAQQVEYVITGTRIVQFDQSGNYLTQFGGTGTTNGLFQLPSGIAVDPNTNNVWGADAILNRIQEFSSTGTYLAQFGSGGRSTGQLLSPYGLVVDGASNVWVADTGNSRIEEFTSNGTFVQSLGALGGGNGQFNGPTGVAILANTLVVSDTGNNRIQVFTLNGTSPPTFVGQFGTYGNSVNTQFKGPFSVALVQLSGLFNTLPTQKFTVALVADPYNQRIMEIVVDSTFAPAGTSAGAIGIYPSLGNTIFSFPSPYGVAIDTGGTIWAVDYGANRIFTYTLTGVNGFQTGTFGVTGGGPGQLFQPTYIAIGFALSRLLRSGISHFFQSTKIGNCCKLSPNWQVPRRDRE